MRKKQLCPSLQNTRGNNSISTTCSPIPKTKSALFLPIPVLALIIGQQGIIFAVLFNYMTLSCERTNEMDFQSSKKSRRKPMLENVKCVYSLLVCLWD